MVSGGKGGGGGGTNIGFSCGGMALDSLESGGEVDLGLGGGCGNGLVFEVGGEGAF